MHWMDYALIVIFFVIVIGSGFIFSRSSAESSKSHFLGHWNAEGWISSGIFAVSAVVL